MEEGEAVPDVTDTLKCTHTETELSSATTSSALPPPLWGGGQGGEVIKKNGKVFLFHFTVPVFDEKILKKRVIS
jgi:hypothetical protein